MAAPTVSVVLIALWDNARMNARSKFLSFGFLGVVAAAGAGTAVFERHLNPPVALVSGELLSPRRALPDFSLIDAGGERFGPAQLRGHWSLLFFGYTNCPDFCPTTLTTLAALDKRLRAQPAAILPQVVFVSVDAARDTPAQLARYVPYFDPRFIGVTARDQSSIETVARQLGVAVIVHSSPDGNYTVDHTGALFVIDPAGRISAILTGPFSVEALQQDFARIVAAPAG
jgi:protein SCO1/2